MEAHKVSEEPKLAPGQAKAPLAGSAGASEELKQESSVARKRAAPDNSKTEENAKNSDKTTGRWRKDEHERFLEGIISSITQLAIKLYGKQWRLVEKYVGTRTGTQVRSHAQKYYMKTTPEAPADQRQRIPQTVPNASLHKNSSNLTPESEVNMEASEERAPMGSLIRSEVWALIKIIGKRREGECETGA